MDTHRHPWIFILKFASVASGAGHAKTFVAASPQKHRFLPHRSRWGARNSRSSPVGVAGALEMAARAPCLAGALEMAALARSVSPGRSKSLLRPARLRESAHISSSSPLGLAGALEMAAQACAASPGLSKSLLRPAQSASLGSSTALLKFHAKKLFENAVLGSRLALDTWLCSSILRAWICSGPR